MAEPIDFEPGSVAEWRQWLRTHHASESGVWLVYAKKAAPKSMPRVSLEEAICEAICFGWVDSKPKKIDANRTGLYFAPRKPGSGWSAINKARVERLRGEGRIDSAGSVVIDAAKADGSWSLLDAVERLTVPPDLTEAFANYDGAAANFEAFPKSVKRGILEWIVQAKRPATRAKRIATTAEMASRNERANQWRRR